MIEYILLYYAMCVNKIIKLYIYTSNIFLNRTFNKYIIFMCERVCEMHIEMFNLDY